MLRSFRCYRSGALELGPSSGRRIVKSYTLLSVFVVFLVSWSSLAGAVPSFSEQFQSEQNLVQVEKRILNEVSHANGVIPGEIRQGYFQLLSIHYGNREDALSRIERFGDALEWALLFRSREGVISEDLRQRIENASNEANDSALLARLKDELKIQVQLSEESQRIHAQILDVREGLSSQFQSFYDHQPVKGAAQNPLPGQFYVLWGYNRTWFTRTDSTFVTPEGTFTIHGSQGYDRPSPFDPKVYFNPTQLSIPQYNLTLGYMFNSRWGIEVGQDHMKWVFDSNQKYQITGDFSPTLYVTDSETPAGNPVAQSFNQIKQSGNATWLKFEHTNGYNYPHVGVIFQQPLYHGPRGKFAMDARFGAGAGLFVPQTSVFMQRDQMWSWKGYDNQFHVAGGGGHASAALKITFFDQFFLLATARGSVIKVTDALVDQSGARLMQSPIGALEMIGQVGYQRSLTPKKRKK